MQFLAPLPQLNKRPDKPFVLTSRHEEIIKAVNSYRYMTALDITRLFYAPTSITHVREILHDLAGGSDFAHNSFLLRFPRPHSHAGNSQRIFILAHGAALIYKKYRALRLTGTCGHLTSRHFPTSIFSMLSA